MEYKARKKIRICSVTAPSSDFWDRKMKTPHASHGIMEVINKILPYYI